jgi:small GTP-binding protein
MRPGIETDNEHERRWKHDSIPGDGTEGNNIRIHPEISPPQQFGAWRAAMALRLPARSVLPADKPPRAARQACLFEKICVLGDSGVGKTSLIQRYTRDHFDFEYLATSGANVTPKKVKVDYREHGLKARLTLQIWDITGDIGREPGTALFRGASGALVVGDAARLETQLDIWKWIEDFRQVAGNVPVLIVINKTDIMDRKEFDQRLVEDISREYDCIYTMTSARNNDRVNEAFGRLTDFMVRRRLIDGPEGAKAC